MGFIHDVFCWKLSAGHTSQVKRNQCGMCERTYLDAFGAFATCHCIILGLEHKPVCLSVDERLSAGERKKRLQTWWKTKAISFSNTLKLLL